MIATIELPDGTLADLYEDGWWCIDATAMPVLEYLTKKVPGDHSRMNVGQVAEAVVAMVNGAKFLAAVHPIGPSTRPTEEQMQACEQQAPIIHNVCTGAVTPEQGIEMLIASGETAEEARRVVDMFTAIYRKAPLPE
jgi:hypothetical protein